MLVVRKPEYACNLCRGTIGVTKRHYSVMFDDDYDDDDEDDADNDSNYVAVEQGLTDGVDFHLCRDCLVGLKNALNNLTEFKSPKKLAKKRNCD